MGATAKTSGFKVLNVSIFLFFILLLIVNYFCSMQLQKVKFYKANFAIICKK